MKDGTDIGRDRVKVSVSRVLWVKKINYFFSFSFFFCGGGGIVKERKRE